MPSGARQDIERHIRERLLAEGDDGHCPDWDGLADKGGNSKQQAVQPYLNTVEPYKYASFSISIRYDAPWAKQKPRPHIELVPLHSDYDSLAG